MNTFGADTSEDVTDWGEVTMEEKRRARCPQCQGWGRRMQELRWVNCEVCGGSGEIIRGRDGDDYNEPAARPRLNR